MKQALRVAFGFLILWASVLHAEVRIVIDSGVDSGRPIALFLSSGRVLVRHLKILAASLLLTCVTAVNLIR